MGTGQISRHDTLILSTVSHPRVEMEGSEIRDEPGILRVIFPECFFRETPCSSPCSKLEALNIPDTWCTKGIVCVSPRNNSCVFAKWISRASDQMDCMEGLYYTISSLDNILGNQNGRSRAYTRSTRHVDKAIPRNRPELDDDGIDHYFICINSRTSLAIVLFTHFLGYLASGMCYLRYYACL